MNQTEDINQDQSGSETLDPIRDHEKIIENALINAILTDLDRKRANNDNIS